MSGFLKVFGLCAVLFAVQVSGISFTVSRDRVVIGSTGSLELVCGVNEPDIGTMFTLQIFRETTSGSGIMEIFAEIKSSDPAEMKVDPGNTDFVAEGTWDASTTSNTELKVVIDLTKIQCSDARAYRCDFTYQKESTSKVEIVQQNKTFSVFVYPSMTSLEGTRNGMYAPNSSTFGVGDILKLACRANIGSLSLTKIEWERTSETSGSVDDFKGYTPAPGTFIEGEPLNDNQCGYTRTATITYNITSADANRDNNLAFRCYVSVSGDPYGQGYTTQNNPSFYVKVNKASEPPTGPATAGTANVGAIAGGVIGGLALIVIIVLLVYFLWYRRRNSGEDYTTKEEYGSENPNMAPPLDTYASVDKHRKSNSPDHGNGVDEPLKPKPKPRGGNQELHYAELDLTKNPPVAPRKKRNEPVEYAEVEFHK